MAHFHLPGRVFSIQFLFFWWILATVLITTTLLLALRQTITAKQFNITAMVGSIVRDLSGQRAVRRPRLG